MDVIIAKKETGSESQAEYCAGCLLRDGCNVLLDELDCSDRIANRPED